jgi:hypothetical protein
MEINKTRDKNGECFFFLWLHRSFSLASLLTFLYHITIRHTVGLLWTSDQPVAEVSTYTGQHNI